MDNLVFGLLPLLTILVIAVNYRMNLAAKGCKQNIALREACWWGGSFFAYGMADYLLLGSFSF